MRRRAYLNALGATLSTIFSGCIAYTSSTSTQKSMDTKFTVCGPASSRSCDSVGINTNVSALEGIYEASPDESEAVSVDPSRKESIRIVGRTTGIGDPKCRTTNLDTVTLDGSKLNVVVRNETNPPLFGGCYETLEQNYYRLEVANLESTVTETQIRHYDGQTLRFDVTVDVSRRS